MSNQDKNLIIIELITKCEPLAYQNLFGVCFFCGGPKKVLDEKNPTFWQAVHFPGCVFLNATRAVEVTDKPIAASGQAEIK